VNPKPVLTVYPSGAVPVEGRNGVIYGLQSKPSFFDADQFLRNPHNASEKQIKQLKSLVSTLNEHENQSGCREFDENFRYEFCARGFAIPPNNGFWQTALRLYCIKWPKTLILLGGGLHKPARGTRDASWQADSGLSKTIGYFIDIHLAIEDGIREGDFGIIPGRAGFFHPGTQNLIEFLTLERYEKDGTRKDCKRKT